MAMSERVPPTFTGRPAARRVRGLIRTTVPVLVSATHPSEPHLDAAGRPAHLNRSAGAATLAVQHRYQALTRAGDPDCSLARGHVRGSSTERDLACRPRTWIHAADGPPRRSRPPRQRPPAARPRGPMPTEAKLSVPGAQCGDRSSPPCAPPGWRPTPARPIEIPHGARPVEIGRPIGFPDRQSIRETVLLVRFATQTTLSREIPKS